jgi:hypothetical protein
VTAIHESSPPIGRNGHVISGSGGRPTLALIRRWRPAQAGKSTVQLLVEKDRKPPAGAPDGQEPDLSGSGLQRREEFWPSVLVDPERFDRLVSVSVYI